MSESPQRVPLSDLTAAPGVRMTAPGFRAALRRSIEHSGLLTPLTVSPRRAGGYTVRDGRTRLSILRELGMDAAEVVVTTPPTPDPLEDDPLREAARAALLHAELPELARVDLVLSLCAERLGESPEEIARAWKKLAADAKKPELEPGGDPDHARTLRGVLESLGVWPHDAFVIRAVALLALPEWLLTPLRLGELTADQAVAMKGFPDGEARTEALSGARDGELTPLALTRLKKRARAAEKAAEGEGDGEGDEPEQSETEVDLAALDELAVLVNQQLSQLPAPARSQGRKHLRALLGVVRVKS